MRDPLLAMAAAILLLAATPCLGDQAASNPHNVPEPQGLHHGDIHGYTPSTLKGGMVLDSAAALAKLMKDAHPVLVDVADRDRKPPTMSNDMIWLPQHRSIPGTDWLPGAGNATDDPAFATAFRSRAAKLTGGNLKTPIVVFCHPDCWASYNAAKRLVGLGYTQVYWYRPGMEGWQEEHDTAVVKPDTAWEGSLPKVSTQ